MTSLEQACTQIADRAIELRLREFAITHGIKWAAEVGAIPEGMTAAEIQLRFRRISICVNHAEFSTPYFETACDIIGRGKKIGSYSLISDLSGEPDDDYWLIDPEVG